MSYGMRTRRCPYQKINKAIFLDTNIFGLTIILDQKTSQIPLFSDWKYFPIKVLFWLFFCSTYIFLYIFLSHVYPLENSKLIRQVLNLSSKSNPLMYLFKRTWQSKIAIGWCAFYDNVKPRSFEQSGCALHVSCHLYQHFTWGKLSSNQWRFWEGCMVSQFMVLKEIHTDIENLASTAPDWLISQ